MAITYCCPFDQSPLTQSENQFSCARCDKRFPISREGIPLLDVIESQEARMFDEKYSDRSLLTDAEVEQSKALATKYLDFALEDWRGEAQHAWNVLDVACGKGELTAGLVLEPRLASSAIGAFDHSLVSLNVLSVTARELGVRERLALSLQDANALCYEPCSFDLIFGNAVLHHFLDWREFFGNIVRLLKPHGRAVFGEPFTAGYAMAMAVFKLAARAAGVSPQAQAAPEMGLYSFITENVAFRIHNKTNLPALATMTDKHFFTVEDFLAEANRHDLRVSFQDYETWEYYSYFMEDLLKSYRITNPVFVKTAIEMWGEITGYLREEAPSVLSHFKLIRFAKGG